MNEFLNLPIGKIIKDESAYEKYYNDRVLSFIKRQPTNENGIKNKFQKCIDLTHNAFELSKKILESINTIGQLESYSAVEIVKKQSEKFDAITESNQYGINQAELENVKNINKKAEELLIKGITDNKKYENSTLLEYLDNELRDEESMKKAMIKTRFATLYSGFDGELKRIQALSYPIFWARIVRGFLFSGIFKIEGKKFEDKILIDDLKNLGNELMGTVVPIGLYKAFLKLWEDFYCLDTTPDLIKNAEFLDSYLENYESLLIQWNIMATQTLELLKIWESKN